MSAMDHYQGYYQVELVRESRDLTAFLTEIRVLRMTRLVQGWTNSVAVFMRIMYKVYCRLIPHKVRPFLNDSGLKGPKSRYNDEMMDAKTSLGTVSVR